MKLWSVVILFVAGVPLGLAGSLAEHGHVLLAGIALIVGAGIAWLAGFTFGVADSTQTHGDGR